MTRGVFFVATHSISPRPAKQTSPFLCAHSTNPTPSPGTHCATRTGHDMASHSTCLLFLKVVLVCLPYTVTGNVDNKSIERSFPPAGRRTAWVAPRMVCARHGDRRSPPMPTWDAGYAMSSVGYGGRGDANGAAGNQGTGAKGGGKSEKGDSNRNSADGGNADQDSGSSSRSNNNSNRNSNSNSNSNSGNSGVSSGGGSGVNDGKGGGGGSGGGGGGGKDDTGPSGDGRATSALERQFAQPAAPNGGLSEGLGKGTPSPSQRLRLQQENLDLRWRMAKKRNTTVCCRQCAGEGVEECRFCAGTGLFKIGSDLIVHPTSGRPPPCPVCKSKGEEVCTRCKGAGRIAAWLLRSERSGDLSGDRG